MTGAPLPDAAPPITSLEDARAQVILAGPHPDWLIGSGGYVWVTVDHGIVVFEPRTGRRAGWMAIDGDLCGAPDAGFNSVWFPTCNPSAIHRVSLANLSVRARIPLELLPTGEFTIGVGEGGVWAALEDRGGAGRLARIDPETERLADVFEIPRGAVSVRAGWGALWVAYPDEHRVRRIDPVTGSVTAVLATDPGPRFLAVGEEGVWVLNQGSGSVTRIDGASGTVAATVPVDRSPIKGGDIAVGNGSVWIRGAKELVAQIDPSSNSVTARYGAPSAGSASLAVVKGRLWISAGAEGILYRIPLA